MAELTVDSTMGAKMADLRVEKLVVSMVEMKVVSMVELTPSD
jgi:hypothetical protein